MELLLEYVTVLVWPAVVLLIALTYRKLLVRLFPGSRVRLVISGVEIETTIPELESSISYSLRGKELTPKQWEYLHELLKHDPQPYDHNEYATLRPLRNAGLIREDPEGTLTDAKEISITPLGRLLLDAHDKR